MSSAYGDHAEQAATALAPLVSGASMPAALHDQAIALGARDIIVSTLRDRLRDHFATQVRNNDPRADQKVATVALQAEPLLELGYVLERFPRLRADDRRAPTDILDAVEDPIASTWVRAARNLLVADHILATAGFGPG
jgi:hypothetical protein